VVNVYWSVKLNAECLSVFFGIRLG